MEVTVDITPAAEFGYLATAITVHRGRPAIVMATSLTQRGARVRALNALARELAWRDEWRAKQAVAAEARRLEAERAQALETLKENTETLRPAWARGQTEGA